MAYEIGLSDAGLVAPRTAEYLEEIREQYAAETGLDVDWDSDLVLGVLTAIMAQLLDQQAEALQAVYDAFDVNGASGVQLSNLAAITGTVRKVAVAAEADVTLSGDVGTVITSDKLVEGGGSDGRARWQLTEDVVIGAGGTVDTVVRAVVAGRTVAIAGEIDEIVTPVPGWDAVTNAADASPGLDAETDAELRVRRQQSIQLSAGLNIAAIRAKVLALDFVENAGVIDNPDAEANIVEGIAMPASSFLVIVTPSSLTTEQEAEALRVIYDNAPVGVTIAGTDVTGTITGADGFEKSVAFDFADDVPANIQAQFTMAAGYTVADAGPALQALVEDHIADLTIGDALRRLAIYGLAADIPGVVALVLLINGVDADLDPDATERVVMGAWQAVAT
jgi:hypothetical protein